MIKHIEVFATGGGITLAEADLNEGRYAVVSSEAPDFLTVYASEDGERTYLPDDMLESMTAADLPEELKELYTEMRHKLMTF